MNSSFENAERGLKRWLKREAKITMATVVAFLITGAVSYGADAVIKNFETQPGKEEIFDYKNGNQTIGNGQIGFSNNKENTLGTVIGNGTLTVGNGGKGYVTTDGGKIFFHAGTEVNVGSGGTGFYTTTGKGNTITSTASGTNYIGHGIVLSAGTINVKGDNFAAGFKAEDGGSIQVGNGRGARATINIDGIGAHIKGNSYISFEADSDTYVNNGFGIFFDKIDNSNSDNPNAIIKNGATFTVNEDIGVNLAGGTKAVVTNESGKFIVNDGTVGFQVDANNEYLLINNKAKTSKIIVKNGTGIKAMNGGYAYYYGQGTIGEMVVEKGGIGFYTNAESEFGTSTTDNGIKESIYLPGGNITVNGGIGFKADGTGAMAIGNDTGYKTEFCTFINVNAGGKGVLLEDNSTAVLGGDARLTVKDGTGIEINTADQKYPKLTLNKDSIVTVNGTDAVGINFKGDNYVDGSKNNTINNGTINVTNGTGVLASGSGNKGDYFEYLIEKSSSGEVTGTKGTGKIAVSGENSVGFKAEKEGYIRFNGSTEEGSGVSVKDNGIGFLADESEIYLRGGNITVDNATGLKAINGGKLSIGANTDKYPVNINVKGNGIGVSLDNGTATLGADVNLTVDDGVGVKFGSGVNTFTNNTSNFVVNGKNAVGFLADSIGEKSTIINENNSEKIIVENGIGIKATNGGIIAYNEILGNGVGKLEVNKDGIGFYTDKTGQNNAESISLADGIINVNGGTGFKADGTGIIVIGDTKGDEARYSAMVTVNDGTGISLADTAKVTLNKDSKLTVNSGIGVDLKGTSVLISNSNVKDQYSKGIIVNGDSIGINVSGENENNNVTVKGIGTVSENTSKVNGTVEVNGVDGIGLKVSDSGNVLNYESGTVDIKALTTKIDNKGYGVFAEDGATIYFGNDLVGTKQADGTSFDTVLNVETNRTGIRVGQKSTVTVGKDVEFKLATGTTGVEIDGGIFENKTTIDVGKDQTGVKFVGEDGKAINTGKIVIEAGGTGFTGDNNNEVINNGTIVVKDTKDPDKSTITTGVGITSNGTIQIGDISDDLTDKTEEEIKKEILDKLVGVNKDLLDIKGLIKDEKDNVVYVAGTDIGTEIPVGPDGKVTIDEIKDKDVAFKTDEETSEDPSKPTDPTETGTVTITGEDGNELIDKVINVGGNLTITGPTGPSTGTGLVLDDVQINMYDKEGKKDDGSDPGIPGEELTFTGKVTVDNTDSGKKVNVGNDKLVIGTGEPGPGSEIKFIGTEITGEDGSEIVIVGNDDKLILDDTDVTINIGPDPTTGIGTGTLVIGTNVGTEDINVDNMIVTGTGNETGEVKTDKLVVTGGGELTSTGIDAGTVTFEDGTIDVSGDGGEIKTDEIIVEDNKYGEIFGGDINVGTGGIKVGVNAELTLDGDTNVGTDDDGDININVGTGGIFTNKGTFTGNGNLDIDNGSYNFETETGKTTSIGGDIFVDNGSLSFKGDGIINIGGGDDKIGDIVVGTDPDGNFADVSFAPESKLADNSSIKFVTGTNGSINIALGDSDQENSILGNPGTGTTLDFTDTAEGTVKFNTDKLTVAEKEIVLNTKGPGDNPFITGLDQNDLGDEKAQADADYIAEYIKGENGNPDKVVLSYNENLLYGYGEEIGEIGSAFRVIHDRVSEAVKKMVGPNATNAEKREAKAKLADSIYTANIYSETVRMSYDNLKMSEDAVLSLKHRTAKGELAGEGKALHSKTEYEREAKVFGNTSSDSEITGLLGAVEYGLSDNTRVGGVFSGSIQDLDAENGKADGNAFYVGAYINKHTSKYEVTAGAGYQFNKFETDNTYLGNTGTEKYDSHALSAYVHGRRIVDLGDGLSFQPKAKLSYSLIEQDDVKDNFMETKDAEIGIFEAEAGFDVVKSIYTDKAKVDVVFGTSLAKAMGDTDKEFEGSFFNETEKLGFKTAGAEIGENKIKFNVGAEVSYENGLFWNGEFNYSFGSKDTETYGVSVGAGYKF